MRRHALVTAVGTFAGAPDPDDPAGAKVFGRLDFACERADAVTESVRRYGYQDMVRQQNATSAELRTAMEANHTKPGLSIVYFVGHGGVDEGKLYLAGRDTSPEHLAATGLDLFAHLDKVNGPPGGPLTLFIVDSCHAGKAVQHVLSKGRQKVWVLAATHGDSPAFTGRFSTAMCKVLDGIAAQRIDIADSEPQITLQMLSTHIHREIQADPGLAQEPWFTGQNTVNPPPAFFPNPFYDPDAARQRASLKELLPDPMARAVLDEVADPEHFRSRAYGHRRRPGSGLPRCLFTGRRQVMEGLSGWLADSAGQPGRLRVITGNPGSGKSAILGALVCASHPVLQPQMIEIRSRLSGLASPPTVRCQAIIHARNRNSAEILTSIAGQLRLAESPPDGWTAVSIAEAVRAKGLSPLITVDGLDEANNPAAVLKKVLLPLHSEGIGKLLVGVRPWDTFEDLFKAARDSDGLLELLPVERNDLEAYLADLLFESQHYQSDYDLIAGIARTAAGKLATGSEYLAAGLFADHLDNLPGPVTDLAAIRAMVPHSLDKLLELRLLTLGESRPLLRPVLSALARAKGVGMPRSVLVPATRAFVSRKVSVSEDDVAEVLRIARFYLRREVDTDGTVLYRMFHQAFDDLLERDSAATSASLLFDSMLRPLDSPSGRQWSRSEPYLRRHAIQHADEAGLIDDLLGDAEFLVYADPETLYLRLGRARSDRSTLLTTIYKTSSHMHRSLDDAGRRDLLALDAARWGADEIARELSRPPWQVRWATGSLLSNALHARLSEHALHIRDADVAILDGRPLLVTAHGHYELRTWDLIDRREVGDPITLPFGSGSGTGIRIACTVVDSQPTAIIADGGHTRHLCDLVTRQVRADPGVVPDTAATQRLRGEVYCEATVHNRPAKVVWAPGVGLTAVDLGDGAVLAVTQLNGDPGRGPTFLRTVNADGGDLVVACSGSAIHVWDLAEPNEPPKQLLRAHRSEVSAMAAFKADDRPMAVTGHLQGALLIWDLLAPQPATTPATGPWTESIETATVEDRATIVAWNPTEFRAWFRDTGYQPVSAIAYRRKKLSSLAAGEVQGMPAVLAAFEDGAVEIWRAGLRHHGWTAVTPASTAGKGSYQVAMAVSQGRTLGLLTRPPSYVEIWDLESGQLIGSLESAATSVRTVLLDGAVVAVTVDPAGIRLWDLASRQQIGTPYSGMSREFTIHPIVHNGRVLALAHDPHRVGIVDVLRKRVRTTLKLEFSHTCLIPAVLNGRLLVIAADPGGLVRLIDADANRQLARPLRIPAPATALAISEPDELVVGFGEDIAVLRLSLTDWAGAQ